jgi:hypothetical protein
MTCDIDVRDPGADILTPEREARLRAEAAQLSQRGELGDVLIEAFDRSTGNPSRVSVEAGPGQEDPVQWAQALLERISAVLGLAPDQARELVADAPPGQTSSGAGAVHFQQHHRGIPVFQARTTVRLTPGGMPPTQVLGTIVPVRDDPGASPRIDAGQSVARAARQLTQAGGGSPAVDAFGQPIPSPSIDLGGYQPVVASGPAGEAKRTRFEAGPFAQPPEARLVWFYVAPEIRLAWQVDLRLPGLPRPFDVIVDATGGETLYCRSWG